jgi:hypothetical protein
MSQDYLLYRSRAIDGLGDYTGEDPTEAQRHAVMKAQTWATLALAEAITNAAAAVSKRI